MIEEMNAAEPHTPARGSELLIEHCAAFDPEERRPSAHERLERLVGGSLARFLIGALTRRRPRAAELD